jgi:hypothetical protein
MYVEANGYEVLEGVICAPYSGAWVAEIQTTAPLISGDSVTLSDGETDLVGTVVTGGSAISRTIARIAGGAGKLAETNSPLHRNGATVGAILGSICSDAGESKSPALSLDVSTTSLARYSAPEGTCGEQIATLASMGGWVWRVLQDGRVWIGRGDQGVPIDDLLILEPHPEDLSFDVAPESLKLWAGTLQNGSVVKRVEYYLGDNLRATYFL